MRGTVKEFIRGIHGWNVSNSSRAAFKVSMTFFGVRELCGQPTALRCGLTPFAKPRKRLRHA